MFRLLVFLTFGTQDEDVLELEGEECSNHTQNPHLNGIFCTSRNGYPSRHGYSRGRKNTRLEGGI